MAFLLSACRINQPLLFYRHCWWGRGKSGDRAFADATFCRWTSHLSLEWTTSDFRTAAINSSTYELEGDDSAVRLKSSANVNDCCMNSDSVCLVCLGNCWVGSEHTVHGRGNIHASGSFRNRSRYSGRNGLEMHYISY